MNYLFRAGYWKRVARLVPGKDAEECYKKHNSIAPTPKGEFHCLMFRCVKDVYVDPKKRKDASKAPATLKTRKDGKFFGGTAKDKRTIRTLLKKVSDMIDLMDWKC